MSKSKSCVSLLSGGIDSSTCLYWALDKGYKVSALTVDYGQLQGRELWCAEEIARSLGVRHEFLKLGLPWKGSSLLDKNIQIPEDRSPNEMINVPSTYVPARNTFLISLALSWAEAEDMDAVVMGAHVQDFSGYPDCRPDFLKSFEMTATLGTKRGREGSPIRILAPLIDKNKADIIRLALELGVPLEKTWSCYRGGNAPCGKCDACILRAKGFREVGVEDPLIKNVSQFAG